VTPLSEYNDCNISNVQIMITWVNSLSLVLRCVFYASWTNSKPDEDKWQRRGDDKIKRKGMKVAPGDGADKASVGNCRCRERKYKAAWWESSSCSAGSSVRPGDLRVSTKSKKQGITQSEVSLSARSYITLPNILRLASLLMFYTKSVY
jgi:hypothetical protein